MSTINEIINSLLERRDLLGVQIVEDKDVLLVDAGVNVKPGLVVGKYLAEISMCGLGSVQIGLSKIGELVLPKIRVVTDYPLITLLSQYAAWIVRDGEDVLYLSGPGRIVARKPRKVFESLSRLGVAVPHVTDPVLVCECSRVPSRDAITKITESLHTGKQPVLLLTSNRSFSGIIQTCARVLEVCLLRLYMLGFNLTSIRSGIGEDVVPPPLSKTLEASALCNDSILYTGQVLLVVDLDDVGMFDDILRRVVRESSYSFTEYVKMYGEEFLVKTSPDMFRIAELTVVNHCGCLRKYGTVDMTSFLRLTIRYR